MQNTDNNDQKKARQLLTVARTADPTLPTELDVYAEETKQLVTTHFAAIERVAARLRSHRDLSYEAICALVLPEAASWVYESNGWRVVTETE